MTFDPTADLIDLRDVYEIASGETGESDVEALAFLMSMLDDLGYRTEGEGTGAFDRARELAETEPTVIADRYFVEYAKELADDLRLTNESHIHQWPFTCIDWKAAADELKADYSSFSFDGRTYWWRSW